MDKFIKEEINSATSQIDGKYFIVCLFIALVLGAMSLNFLLGDSEHDMEMRKPNTTYSEKTYTAKQGTIYIHNTLW